MKRYIFYTMLLALFAFSPVERKKITIWMIGDSTMSIKDTKVYPETGWGMPFVYFWDSTVKVNNLAANGRSTKTFLEEGRWDPVMKGMQEGDYVFIQFGHNDEAPTKKSYINEEGYKKLLIKYVTETRLKNATPILLTPMARRKFDSTGNVVETHAVYGQIVRDVAKENNVILIDMSETSKALIQQWGPKESVYLFHQLAPGDHPNFPEGKVDNTHLSELGARKMAGLVLTDIRKLVPELAARIYVPVKKD